MNEEPSPATPATPDLILLHPMLELRGLQMNNRISSTAMCLLVATDQLEKRDVEATPPTLSVLAKLLNVSTASITVAVDLLTVRDLASRVASPVDRRRFSLKIHERGESLIEDVNRVLEKPFQG